MYPAPPVTITFMPRCPRADSTRVSDTDPGHDSRAAPSLPASSPSLTRSCPGMLHGNPALSTAGPVELYKTELVFTIFNRLPNAARVCRPAPDRRANLRIHG